MEFKSDRTVTGLPRWACPWAAGWSGMHKNSAPNYEHELFGLTRGDRLRAENGLPKNSQRRIQRIGVAAIGVAATVWVLGVAWVLQIIS